MPTLDWIGKQAVVNHHREVPYRLIHCDAELSAGELSGELVEQEKGDPVLAAGVARGLERGHRSEARDLVEQEEHAVPRDRSSRAR
jgi:hypothetical protein